MKVVILTIHEAMNFGAVLQSYALQKVISYLGYKTGILDYHCNKIKNSHSIFYIEGYGNYRLLNILKFFYLFFVAVCYLPFKCYRKIKYNLFLKKSYNLVSLKDLAKQDCIVVGSDQVWNLGLTGEDTTYFCYVVFFLLNFQTSY